MIRKPLVTFNDISDKIAVKPSRLHESFATLKKGSLLKKATDCPVSLMFPGRFRNINTNK